MIGQRNVKMRRAGKELDRISRGLNTKIALHVADGNRRPEAPMQAAKLASEAGFALRDHIPILPCWKDYEDENNKDLLADFQGKVAVSTQSVLYAIEKFHQMKPLFVSVSYVMPIVQVAKIVPFCSYHYRSSVASELYYIDMC